MKKFVVIALVLLLCLALLAGYAANASQASEQEPAGEPAALPGGWTVAEPWEMTDELRAVFDAAMEGLVGVDYTPVACLGRQVVAGTNYAIFCQARAVSPDAAPYYAVVTLCEDPQGGAELLDITAMTPSGQPDENAGTAAPLAGGWSVPETEDEGLAAFEQAAERLVGVDYTPIRVLGQQVVSGMNYCVLCRARAVTPDAAPYNCLVRVYQDLNGSASVTDVAELTVPGAR